MTAEKHATNTTGRPRTRPVGSTHFDIGAKFLDTGVVGTQPHPASTTRVQVAFTPVLHRHQAAPPPGRVAPPRRFVACRGPAGRPVGHQGRAAPSSDSDATLRCLQPGLDLAGAARNSISSERRIDKLRMGSTEMEKLANKEGARRTIYYTNKLSDSQGGGYQRTGQYLGEWHDNQFGGKGSYELANGNRYVGAWADGERAVGQARRQAAQAVRRPVAQPWSAPPAETLVSNRSTPVFCRLASTRHACQFV